MFRERRVSPDMAMPPAEAGGIAGARRVRSGRARRGLGRRGRRSLDRRRDAWRADRRDGRRGRAAGGDRAADGHREREGNQNSLDHDVGSSVKPGAPMGGTAGKAPETAPRVAGTTTMTDGTETRGTIASPDGGRSLQASRSVRPGAARCGAAPLRRGCNEGDTGCRIATPPLEANEPDAASASTTRPPRAARRRPMTD